MIWPILFIELFFHFLPTVPFREYFLEKPQFNAKFIHFPLSLIFRPIMMVLMKHEFHQIGIMGRIFYESEGIRWILNHCPISSDAF